MSKSNKNLPLSTGISRRGNQKQSFTGHEDTQVFSQTGKYFENCGDNANVQPPLSLPETYGEDYRDWAECQEVTLTAGIPKIVHDNEAVDNQEDIKNFWIDFSRNFGREFFIFCSQLIFVFVSVVFYTLRMLIVSLLSCQERTANTMILSNCIPHLLLNANSLRKPFD